MEVGIKLSGEMELALQIEKETVKLFRSVEIRCCLGNWKGREYEMALRKLATGYHDGGEDVIFIKDTPLYKAASKEGDTKRLGTSYSGMSMNKVIPPPSTLSVTGNDGCQRPHTAKYLMR